MSKINGIQGNIAIGKGGSPIFIIIASLLAIIGIIAGISILIAGTANIIAGSIVLVTITGIWTIIIIQRIRIAGTSR